MKSIFQSKTLYFNLITGIVVVATLGFGYQPDEVFAANLAAIITNPLFIISVNALLRLVTDKKLVIKPQA